MMSVGISRTSITPQCNHSMKVKHGHTDTRGKDPGSGSPGFSVSTSEAGKGQRRRGLTGLWLYPAVENPTGTTRQERAKN